MADSANVFVAAPPQAAGTWFAAPKGTELPTDADSELDPTDFKDPGYIGEEGVTRAETRDTTDLKAFGGDTVATTQNSYDVTYTVTLLEDGNPEVAKIVNNTANVSTAVPGVTRILLNKLRPERKVFVFDTIAEGDRIKRQIIPDGQVTGVGDVVFVHTDCVKYTATIKAYPSPAAPSDSNVIVYDGKAAA